MAEISRGVLDSVIPFNGARIPHEGGHLVPSHVLSKMSI